MMNSQKMMILIPAFLMFFGFSGVATEVKKNLSSNEKSAIRAGSFFVDQTHASASDKNPGTEALPFKSIRGALTKVKLKPKDTLWIKDGTYREFVWLEPKPFRYNKRWTPVIQPNSGLSYAESITISAFPGHKPVIKGSDVVTGWKKFKKNIWVKNWDENSQQVFVDGKVSRQIGGEMIRALSGRRFRGRLGNDIKDMFAGSFYYDLKEKKLYIWLKENRDPNKCLIEVSVRPACFWLGTMSFYRTKFKYRYMKINGLKSYHSNMSAYGGSGMTVITGEHNVMENCESSWSDVGGGSIVGNYHSIINSKFNHNGMAGLGGSDTRGIKILNCETSYNNYRNWNASWAAGGCKFIPNCHDMIVKGHIAAYNHESPGIWFDGANSNVTIENCLVYRNGKAGIMYEISTRAMIKNNICYENAQRGIYISNSSHNALLNNLCYRNGMAGIAIVAVARPKGLHGRGKDDICPGGKNVVWGNVFVDNCWSASWTSKNHQNWRRRPELIMPPEVDVHTGNISDYNLFYRSGKRAKNAKYLGQNFSYAANLKDWQKKTGMDKHSIIAKPIFKNEKSYDFHPVKGSPALFLVKPDMSVLVDYDDVQRPRKMYHTAGPFSSPPKFIKNIQSKPQVDKYGIIVLKNAKKIKKHKEAATLAGYFAIRSHHKRIAPGIYGMKAGEIPFGFEIKKELIIDKECSKASIKIGKQVKNLYFLCMGADSSNKAIARCVITLANGTTRTLEWSGDSKGGLTSIPAQDTLTKQVAFSKDLGYHEFLKRKIIKIDYRIFMTTWKNDNEWYPVKKLDFKILDPKAIMCFFAITSEDLIEK